MPDILSRRALPSGRFTALGVTTNLPHGTLVAHGRRPGIQPLRDTDLEYIDS